MAARDEIIKAANVVNSILGVENVNERARSNEASNVEEAAVMK